MVWLPTFLVEHRVSTGSAAAATALMVVANIPGNLSGGWLLSRGVPRGTLVIGATAVSALCEIGMLSDSLPGALRYVLVLVFSTCAGVIPASTSPACRCTQDAAAHRTAHGIVMAGVAVRPVPRPAGDRLDRHPLRQLAAFTWVLLHSPPAPPPAASPSAG